MKIKANTIYIDGNNVYYKIRNKNLYVNGEIVETAKNNQILLDKLAKIPDLQKAVITF